MFKVGGLKGARPVFGTRAGWLGNFNHVQKQLLVRFKQGRFINMTEEKDHPR